VAAEEGVNRAGPKRTIGQEPAVTRERTDNYQEFPLIHCIYVVGVYVCAKDLYLAAPPSFGTSGCWFCQWRNEVGESVTEGIFA